MKNIALSVAVFGVALSGCVPKPPTPDLVVEKKLRESQGWAYVATVGTENDDAKYVAHLTSPTAASVTAYASTGDKRTDKQFAQDKFQYLVITMARPSGDTFSLVFSKSKP